MERYLWRHHQQFLVKKFWLLYLRKVAKVMCKYLFCVFIKDFTIFKALIGLINLKVLVVGYGNGHIEKEAGKNGPEDYK